MPNNNSYNFISKLHVNLNNISNLGSKNIYQNQNNPDYFYEDPRLKVEQSNGIPQAQLVCAKIFMILYYTVV